MKVISIWNPYATLLVKGFKLNETRSWAAPTSLIGQRIAIASTKHIRPDQRLEVTDEKFARYYKDKNLPLLPSGHADIAGMMNGYILGTVELHSCDLITEEDLDDITEEELAFGWYSVGRYAWRCRNPIEFMTPVPARGQQGIWEWFGEELPHYSADPERQEALRSHLRVVD